MQAEMIQRSLSARIQADLAAAQFLVDSIAANPDMPFSGLEQIADSLIARNSHFASIGIAPGFNAVSVRPAPDLKGDTRSMIKQQLAVFAARLDAAAATGGQSSPSLAWSNDGYLNLIYPVVPKPPNGVAPWGAIVVAIDGGDFYATTGLKPNAGSNSGALHDIDDFMLSIRQVEPTGALVPFFGDAAAEIEQPVTKTVAFPGGAWEIAAAPREGWNSAPENQLPFRLALAIAATSLIIPIVIAVLLLAERNRNIEKLKAREEKLLELSRRFNLAMESSNIGIWEVRGDDRHLYWDERSAALHGCDTSLNEYDDRLEDWTGVVHSSDRGIAEAHFFETTSSDAGGTVEMVYRIVKPDGSIRHLRSVGARCEDAGGKTRVTGIVWDVTADTMVNQTLRHAKETSEIKNAELELALDELSSREHELAELSQKFDLALASYNCGIWEGDPDNGGAVWDERMHQLYGLPYKPTKRTEEEWLNCIYPEDRAEILQEVRRAIARGSGIQSVQRILLPDGSFRFVRSVGQLHTGRDGKKKIIGIAFDITADKLLTEELKVAKEEADTRNMELEIAKNRIEFNALHDPLTSLANRRKFDMELDALSKSSQTARQKFSILHLDLDRFKEINDTLGHAAGDAMLIHASRILRQNVRRSDLVARIGGDEFVILTKDTTDAEHLSQLSQRIIEQMSRPIDFEGFACRCGVSIGIAQSSGSQIDARKVLINADIALYEAKEKGRNCFEFFTHELQANIVNSKRMADEILAGLERDEFTVWYQPQFDTHTMQLVGAEALVRWNHPERGILPSGVFLKTAEELNVMARIDQIVLEKSLRDKMRWTAQGINIPKISVNVSSKRLHDGSLIESLKGLNLVPGEISFELVESIFLDETDDVVATNINQIKELGIDIEIDDFGTGHTSIVSLLKLKPKRLKIDRQLVMPILESPQERAMVRSIIDIARSLGVESVAEGVETRAHADLLRVLGCDLLQGFAFAKPLPFEEFNAIASRDAWLKAS